MMEGTVSSIPKRRRRRRRGGEGKEMEEKEWK